MPCGRNVPYHAPGATVASAITVTFAALALSLLTAPTHVAAQATIAFTAFPAPGSLSAVAGKVNGLPQGGAGYKAVLYMQIPGGSWWSKPTPGASVPLAADGTFRFDGWASYPTGDVDFTALAVQVMPASAGAASALGEPLPQPAGVLVASRTAPRGFVPDAISPGQPAAQPQPPASGPAAGGGPSNNAGGASSQAGAASGASNLMVTGPRPGTSEPIIGRLTGAPRGSVIVVYVRLNGGGVWGPKPGVASTFPVAADGSFRIEGWVQLPADALCTSLEIMALPPGGQAATALGLTRLPQAGIAPLATIAVPRGMTVMTGGSGASQPQPPPGGSGGAGGAAAPPPAAGGGVAGMSTASATGAGGAMLSVTAPVAGSAGAITGKLTGVPIAGQRIAAYVQLDSGSIWGAKPSGSSTAAVQADGSFSIANWASVGSEDASSPTLIVVALPAGLAVAPVLGASALPDVIRGAALVVVSVDRRTASGGSPAGGNGAATGGGSGGFPEEIPWPPADAGAVVRPAGGMIQWAG